ncbi:MAG: CBS domain-containing protein [Sphingobacteriia bacterium]|nr:CBS domain-containing protein [Sphingobacteriia bacterium]NCC41638.1 CBS domain-containing protein [Gammaproteobacteria bacterium]
MQVVTTHTNTDFDALASMVAASFLYPGLVRVMPSQAQPAVREFLAVHWDLLQLKPRRAIDLSRIDRLVVTDTASWERLDDMQSLAARADLECIVWDHHMTPGSIAASELHLEEVGASVTLLLERIQAEDRAFPPMQATLFLLGIYDDTGSLSFPSTTARDARMAAFLLENGADLNVVAAYLDNSLDPRHLDLFNRMLTDARILENNGVRVGLCVQAADKGLNNLARVVGAFMKIQGLDAAFGIFPLSANKTVVVGRANPRVFDAGTLIRRLGGGGHPGAGSAVLKAPAEQVQEQLLALIEQSQRHTETVRDLMTPITTTLSPRDSLRDAVERLASTQRSALLVLDDEGLIVGTLGEEQLLKVRDESAWGHPVAALVKPNPTTVTPDQTVREALRSMAQAELGFLPVMDGGRPIGEITRSAIILSLYDLG